MILGKRPDIERFLKTPTPGIRAALIYGRDLGVVRERGHELAGRIAKDPNDPFDVAQLTDGDLDGDAARLEGELSAQSLMGGRRLVRLRFGTEKAALDKLAAEALTRHAEGELNPDAFLLVEAGNLGRDSALRKAAEKAAGAAAIPCYEDEPGDVARQVREALARDNISLSSEALQLFVARMPKERGVARQEMERLALYLGPGSGAQATPADLEPFLGVEPEASLSDAASDAFGGRLGEAQAGLRRALTLAKAGAGLQEAAKAAGVFWKQEREFLRQARAWTLDHLDSLQPDLLEADKACKTTGSPDGLIAERLVLSIAGRARRLGL